MSQSRASTSRGSTSGRSRDFQRQDFSFLLEPDALELIQLNKLKLVPIDEEDPTVPCDTCADFQLVRDERDIVRNRLAARETEVTELRRRVIELEDQLVARGSRRDLEENVEELQVRLESQADTFNELQNECQAQLDEERGKREEAERRLKEREERLRVLESQLIEKDRKFQEREVTLQESLTRDRNRIIVLSNEKEGITQERFKFSGFAKQVKIILGYGENQGGDDLLGGEQLERILEEVKKLKMYKNQDENELQKNRDLLQQIFRLSGTADIIERGRREDNQVSPSISTSVTSPSSSSTFTSYFRINNEASRASLFLSKNPTPPPSTTSSTSVPPSPPSTPVTYAELPCTSSAAAALHPAHIRITNSSPSPLSPNLAEPSTLSTNAQSPQNDAMIIDSPTSSPAPSGGPPGVATIPSLTSPSSSQALQIPTPPSPNQITIINSYSLAKSSSQCQNQVEAPAPSASPSISSPPAPPPSPAIPAPPPPSAAIPAPPPPSAAIPAPPPPSAAIPAPPPPSPAISLPPPPPPVSSTPVKPSKKPKNPQVNRNGQLTEYAVSTKPHGANKACANFRCFCGKLYSNEKSLNVHVRKMKTAWKYKCNKCLHYFFYKSDLTRHLARSSKCSDSNEPGGSASFLNDTLFDELIGVRGPSVPPPSTSTSTAMQLTISTSSGTRQGTFTKSRNQGKRKLQQEILKRKRHAPWVSKNGAVQGSWYCVCGSKFGLRASMQTHVQYFTQDWKFQCDHCPETFLYLAYLKKHMASTHKMKNALKEYLMGCQLCGSLFKKRSDYYRHRKIIHNLIRKRPGTSSSKKGTVPPAPPKSPEKTNAPSPPPRRSSNSSVIPLPPPPSIIVLPNSDPQQGPSGITPNVKPMEVIEVPSDDDVEMIPLSPPPVTIKQERAASPSPSTISSVSSAESVESSASGEGQNHAIVESDPLYVDARNPNAQLFSCECGKTYLSRSALGLHIKTMKFGNIYVCMTCNKGFRQLINLKNHMTSVHRDVYKGFYCGLCKMQFTSSRLFKIHRLKAHDN